MDALRHSPHSAHTIAYIHKIASDPYFAVILILRSTLAAFQLDEIRAKTRKLKHVAQMSAQMPLNMSLDRQLDKIRN